MEAEEYLNCWSVAVFQKPDNLFEAIRNDPIILRDGIIALIAGIVLIILINWSVHRLRAINYRFVKPGHKKMESLVL